MLSIKYDENLARFIAHIQADGCFSKERNYFRYFNKELELIKNFQNAVLSSFGLICNKPYFGSTCIHIGFSNKLVSQLLIDVEFSSSNWKIPYFVLNGALSIKAAYLQAFFDDEGCVTFRKRKEGSDRFIRLQSINKEGINQLKSLLKYFEIDSRVYEPIRGKYFELKIMKRDNLEKFMQLINFLHIKKRQKLELAVNTYCSTKKA